ncbi:endo alpha-1,4 polygalactosaminidase [Cellulosimicrobium sp. Marseille-Q4280]|uniref:endo alpha-1,4 polygalactosaminidase n=1 Tax=Cellulosimicrobium sp. Marseille-Q4280 TaxID=2937992 RepID=UPI00203A4AD8|nr:endo alpha-1,4 polygalactosaminidase [Cellulosimicrobium sp. Marseille-Q4280]
MSPPSRAGAEPVAAVVIAVAAATALAGCSSSTSSPDAYRLPPTEGTFDYQLGAAYDLPGGLDVVVRDATAEPAGGAYSVCYVNGFQTQPGEEDRWLGEHEDLLLHDASGELVVDPDWPDELVLDPSTAAQRAGILEVLGPVVTGCADAGFDAVEIDNLDTWTRFDDPATGRVDEEGALALAAAYVDLAHGAGLAVAQKNAAEIAVVAHDKLGFDVAVTEECAVYDECAAYTDVYGDHVLQVEYVDALPAPFADVCARADRARLTVLRDRDLVGPDDAGYVREQC